MKFDFCRGRQRISYRTVQTFWFRRCSKGIDAAPDIHPGLRTVFTRGNFAGYHESQVIQRLKLDKPSWNVSEEVTFLLKKLGVAELIPDRKRFLST